jgi:pimeloyl-ACP methyl ester carboxylesterase
MTPSRFRLFLALGTLAAGASALAVRYQTRKAERENPPAGRFLHVDGVRLHYVERGNGDPVVLLHGNGTMMQDFELSGVLELASAHYRVIAFDRPGYGYSSRPRRRLWSPGAQAKLLHDALARLGIDRPVIVGHSWGTLVAIAYALRYREDVKSLVLLSGYYFPAVGEAMRQTLSPLLGRLMWPRLMRSFFGPAPTPRRFERDYPKWLSLRPSQLRAAAAEAALLIPAAAALRRCYRLLRIPAVIVAGAQDRHVNSMRHSAKLHEAVAQSELRMVADAGHMVHHAAPRKIVAAIDRAAALA